MGTVTGFTLGVSFVSLDTEIPELAGSGIVIEEVVSTGGSCIREEVIPSFEIRAASTPTALAAAALGNEGVVVAERLEGAVGLRSKVTNPWSDARDRSSFSDTNRPPGSTLLT